VDRQTLSADAFRQNAEHIPALVAELDWTVTEMERLGGE